MINLANNQGAMLLGGCFATGLSGVLAAQVLLYFRLYPTDPKNVKCLVLFIWLLDVTHTGLMLAGLWDRLIVHFGDHHAVLQIPVIVACTVSFTAITTFVVHCFFAHRIFCLSAGNWMVVTPILILAFCRLCSAFTTSREMMHLGSFPSFVEHVRWLAVLGLSLSTIIDVLITLILFFLFQTSRSGSMSLSHIIDSLILYTLQMGSLTSAGATATMICFLSMGNLIFMALHFIIGKLYANSLIASLNARYQLRNTMAERDHVVMFPSFSIFSSKEQDKTRHDSRTGLTTCSSS